MSERTMTASADSSRAAVLNEIARQRFSDYVADGASASLVEAIARWREAVAVMPADSPDRAEPLGNLGVGLLRRYDRNGNLADLDAGISHVWEALSLTPPFDSANRASGLINLSSG